ncbi:class I SAM-dependent methyltransferase [Candidatus Bathyarchaeota archaeon]|nr:class I SAM-dependent methyltransferase [Candidatus Bathyarchaeota archaeon]
MSDDLANFIFCESDWMYKEFNRLEAVRSPKYFTLKAALNMFLQNDGQLIVETGTQRVIDDPGGSSTLLFGAFCERYKKRLITVDNDPTHMETSKQATQQYKDYITYALTDSVTFLQGFNEPIDLLYLDSLDCPFPPASATEAQMHNLNELKAAYNKLHKGSILLIDDNNLENGGKTRLSKKFLLETGEWQCIFDGGQTLWMRRC